MQALFLGAMACLAAGVVLWLVRPGSGLAASLLAIGLLGLLAMPILKLVAILVTSARERDWVTLAATLAVMAILFALTIRDASR